MAQTTYHPAKGKDADVANLTVSGTLAVTGATTQTGVITAPHRHPVQTLTATGAITLTSGIVILNHATVIIAATLAAPTAGDELFIIDGSASGTAAHTVTLPEGVTFNVTGNNTATLNAPDEALHIVAQSATQWRIMSNMGSVALSTV